MADDASIIDNQPADSVWLFPTEQLFMNAYHIYTEAPLAGYQDSEISFQCINKNGGRWLLTASNATKGTLNYIFVWDYRRGDVDAMKHGWTAAGAFYLAVPVREQYVPKNAGA